MKCDEFDLKLSAYHDGELDRDPREEVFLHLQNCESCQKRLEEFKRVDSFMKRMPNIEASESFSLQIISRISKEERSQSVRAPFLKFVFSRFLRMADSFFELISGQTPREDSLEEFSDFPPLSIGHAYFQVIGLQR